MPIDSHGNTESQLIDLRNLIKNYKAGGGEVRVLQEINLTIGPGEFVVDEMDATKVEAGDPAVVTFDAIPGLELRGEVIRVGAYGQNRLGEIVYTVAIRLEKTGARLRWNMTAMVRIGTE